MFTYLFLALLACIITWRIILPGMKTGSWKTHSTGTPLPGATPATAGGGAPAVTPPRGTDTERWYSEYGWSILFVIVGVVVVYWGFQNTQIRPADAGSWSWTHWLPLLIIWGTLSVLITLNKKALGEAVTVLQTVLAVTMVGALVVLPLVHAIWGESSSSQQTLERCPHYSSLVDRECTITEKPTILVTEEVTREGESELCYLKPKSAVLLTNKVGVNSFEFKSANGVFPIRYKLVRRTDMVNGKCPKKF